MIKFCRLKLKALSITPLPLIITDNNENDYANLIVILIVEIFQLLLVSYFSSWTKQCYILTKTNDWRMICDENIRMP